MVNLFQDHSTVSLHYAFITILDFTPKELVKFNKNYDFISDKLFEYLKVYASLIDNIDK